MARYAPRSAPPSARRYIPPAVVFAVVCLLPTVGEAQQVEEILSFDVTVDVQEDGWLEVTENIRVRALGREIKRGIYRDFPTRFPRQSGLGRMTAPFEVVRVVKDGAATPYVLQSVGGPAGRGGIRVRIGDPDVFIRRGEHTYSLTYRTTRWLNFRTATTELYWNVTGNGWTFPIRSASADVLLPGKVAEDAVTLEGWTGPEGSQASDVVASFHTGSGSGSRSRATFQTTAPLGRFEGLTIRLTFPAGLVAAPTPEQQAEWFRLDWGPYVDAGILVLWVLGLYGLMWVFVGRDPPGRPVVVQYDPPEGFSPAALGYLDDRGYDNRQLTATIVSLAVKGVLRIEHGAKHWTLRRIGEVPRTTSHEERRVVDKLLPADDSIVILGITRRRVQEAEKALRRGLRRRLEVHYFVTNRRWFIAGLLISAAGFAALASRTRFPIATDGWNMAFQLLFWTLLSSRFLTLGFRDWRAGLAGGAQPLLGVIGFPLVAAVPVSILALLAHGVYREVPLHLLLAVLALGGVNVLFYHLLERPTLAGRGVLGRVEGFKRFLEATDGGRLDRLQAEGAPLELFERFLPHAIALGVGSRWAARFGAALTSGVPGDGPPGGSSWYSGQGADSLGGLTSSLSGAFSSSLSASASVSGSGGGSAGGGGGGGGGGGW